MLSQESCIHTDDQRAFTGTWITEEVKKAKEMGYKVLKVRYILNEASTKIIICYL